MNAVRPLAALAVILASAAPAAAETLPIEVQKTAFDASPFQLKPAPASTTSQVLFYSAAGLAFIGALGHTLTSVPAVSGRYAPAETDRYWRDRLTANLLLGTSQLYLTGFTSLLGAAWSGSEDPGKRDAARQILALSVVPHLFSALLLPALTPEDWPHAVPHVLSAGLITTGLTLTW